MLSNWTKTYSTVQGY